MTANPPEMNDEQFERLLELTGTQLAMPPMRDSVDTALASIRSEQGMSRPAHNNCGAWGGSRTGRPPGATASPSLVVGQSPRSRGRELALFAVGVAAAAVVALVLLLVFRGFDNGSHDGDDLGGAAIATSTGTTDPATNTPDPAVVPTAVQPESSAASPEASATTAPSIGSSVLLRTADAVEGSSVQPVDPATGEPLPGHEPVNGGVSSFISSQSISSAGPILAMIESNGSVSEPNSGGYSTRGSADALHLVDLATWIDVTAELPGDSWAGSINFSPDGSRVTLGLNSSRDSRLLVFDAHTAELLAERTLAFRPSLVSYSGDESQLIVYGQPRSENPGIVQPGPPQFALLDARTLDPVWEQTLPDVMSGSWCLDDCEKPHDMDSASRFVSWSPGVVASPDGSRLYIVHADADRLTTVDFTARSVQTREIKQPEALLDRFLGLFFEDASAKGERTGTSKDVEISPDGTALYVLGGFSSDTRDPDDDTHRLQIIDVASATEVASHGLETGGWMELTPDGRYLMFFWLGESPSEPNMNQTWTEIRDAHNLDVVARLEAWDVTVSRSLDGELVVLAARPNYSDETTELAALDPDTFEIVSSWTVDGIASWVAAQGP